MMNRKIAVICNYELLPSRVGGMDHFFWMFDDRCKQNGVQVEWFFPNISDHGNYKKLNIIPSNGKSVEQSFLNHSRLAANNYTHIITHFIELCTPFFAKIAPLKAKIIAVDHNPRPLGGYSFKKRIEKRLKGLLFAKYISIFVGVSNYTKRQILHDFGFQLSKKTIVIYNGVLIDGILVRAIRYKNRPSFIVASHLRESKGIQDLIEAVATLPDDVKRDIQIDVYGAGPFEGFLLQKTAAYNLNENINFCGSKSNLKEVFCQYDYLLQPTHMECFSLSILESLAANVPVITTSVGGNEEVVTNEENGYIVKPKDTSALSDIIAAVFRGDKTIEVNTRELIAKSYALETMTENHFKLVL